MSAVAALAGRLQPAGITGAAARLLPGIVAAIAVAAVARSSTSILPKEISEVTVAIVLGLVVSFVAGRVVVRRPDLRSATAQPGLKFAAERILRLGIILIGAKLSVQQIAAIGLPAAVIVIVTMACALSLVLALASAASVDDRLRVLLAVGAAVCGNTAVVATSPVISARPRDTAYAVATVTLFGTIAVIVYPLLGHALHLGDAPFGLWSGIAINDTSQVLGASNAYSPGAAEIATVVKLIRNALMAPLLIGIAWAWSRRTGEAGDTRAGIRRALPWFVLGFLGLAALRSVGLIDDAVATSLDGIARTFILVALAAVGLNVRLDNLREVGPRPLLVGLGGAVVIGTAALAAIVGLNLASGLALD